MTSMRYATLHDTRFGPAIEMPATRSYFVFDHNLNAIVNLWTSHIGCARWTEALVPFRLSSSSFSACLA